MCANSGRSKNPDEEIKETRKPSDKGEKKAPDAYVSDEGDSGSPPHGDLLPADCRTVPLGHPTLRLSCAPQERQSQAVRGYEVLVEGTSAG